MGANLCRRPLIYYTIHAGLPSETQREAAPPSDMAVAAVSRSWQAPGSSITLLTRPGIVRGQADKRPHTGFY